MQCNAWKRLGKSFSKFEILGHGFENLWIYRLLKRHNVLKNYAFLVAYKSINTRIRVHVTDLRYFKFLISINSFPIFGCLSFFNSILSLYLSFDLHESDGAANTVHRVNNYPILRPKMPRYCCPLRFNTDMTKVYNCLPRPPSRGMCRKVFFPRTQ